MVFFARYFPCYLRTHQHNLVRQSKDDYDGNHKDRANSSASAVNVSTLNPHSLPVLITGILVLRGTVSLTVEGFDSSVKTLHYGKGKHIDEHGTHSHAGNKGRIICVSDVVGVDQLHKHVKEHAYNWPN